MKNELISNCCGADIVLKQIGHPHCFACMKPCTARKSAFDLDGFLAGAEKAGEILDRKEKTDGEIAATISKHFGHAIERLGEAGIKLENPHFEIGPEKTAQEKVDVILDGRHLVEGVDYIRNGAASILHSKLPPPPNGWEEKLESVSIPTWSEKGEYKHDHAALKAFITRTVKEAEERGYKAGFNGFLPTEEQGFTKQLDIIRSEARAERTKEIVEIVKEMWTDFDGQCEGEACTLYRKILARLTNP